jgi:hypothetical protein
MTRLVNDIVTRLYLNGAWRDISTDVRAEKGVSINRGRRPEDDTTPPQSCEFTLDNRSGDYTERDPMGTWYEYLARNTPMEMSLRLAKDTCSATVSNGWGTTEAGAATDPPWTTYTWSTFGGAASDYNKASGKATHLISSAAAGRISYLADYDQRESDITVSLTLGFTNVTGGALGVDLLFHGQSTSVYYIARFLILTDESVTAEITNATGDVVRPAVTVPGVTHSSSQALHCRAQCEGRTIRLKVWQGADRETTEPYDWVVEFTDEADSGFTDDLVDVAGWVGVRSITAAGNTNVPVTFSYDNIDLKQPLFAGEIAEWPQHRDVTGNDRTVSVTASGLRRRLGQGRTLTRSALHQFIARNTFNPTPIAYWPLEDGARTVTSAVNAVEGSGSSLQFVPPTAGSSVGKIEWAGDTSREGSKQSPTLTGGGSLVANISPVAAAAGWMAGWQHKLNYSDGAFALLETDSATGTAISIVPLLNPGTLVLDIGLEGPGVSTTMMSHTFTDRDEVESWHTIMISAEQNGSSVDFFLYIDGAVADSHTQASLVLTGLKKVQLSSVTNASGDTGIGHVAVWNNPLNVDYIGVDDAARGNPGEIPLRRVHRLCREYDVEFDWIGLGATSNDGDGKPMGPQRVVTLLELLNDAELVDGGLLYEQRSAIALQFRSLRSMFSREPWVELNMATSKHISPPWTPTSDDRNIANEVTARRDAGGEYTVSLDTGRMSTLLPSEGGIGRYPTSVTFNVESDTDLPDLASHVLARGTIDEERYPELTIELHRDAVRNTAGLVAKLLDLDVGDVIKLSGLTATGIYDEPEELVIGYSRYLDRFLHVLKPRTVPASLLRVWTPGSTAGAASEFARLDSDATTIDEDLDTTETAVTIEVAAGKAFWVNSTSYSDHFPFDVVVGGEVMTVTACTTPSGQNQTMTVTRSVNGVVKTHSNGAKLSLARPNYFGL